MGFWAHGTQVSIDSVGIGGLTSVSFPQEEKDLVEITAHDSGGDREYVPGLRDGGTVDLAMRIRSLDVGQQALWANYGANNNPLATFVITVPADPEETGSEFTLTFQGFAISRGGDLPFDDAGEQTYSIKISGAVTHSLVSV